MTAYELRISALSSEVCSSDLGVAYHVLDARTGQLASRVDEQAALDEAQAFMPSAHVHYSGLVHEDRWTHSRGLDVHRPLHVVQVDGEHPATVYVSSATGQTVMDAPLSQQRWNYEIGRAHVRNPVTNAHLVC